MCVRRCRGHRGKDSAVRSSGKSLFFLWVSFFSDSECIMTHCASILRHQRGHLVRRSSVPCLPTPVPDELYRTWRRFARNGVVRVRSYLGRPDRQIELRAVDRQWPCRIRYSRPVLNRTNSRSSLSSLYSATDELVAVFRQTTNVRCRWGHHGTFLVPPAPS